jgi:HlyD family secretion protein
MKTILKRTLWLVILLGVAVFIANVLRPPPVLVDLAKVTRGPMQMTLDEDGETRIKERYVVSAPLGGRLQRIGLKSGDAVTADETLLVTIEPRDPALLDPRERAELGARVSGSGAAVERAHAELHRIQAEAALAQRELQRVQSLHGKGGLSLQQIDEAAVRAQSTAQAVKSAESAVRVAEFEQQQAQAAYTRSSPATKPPPPPVVMPSSSSEPLPNEPPAQTSGKQHGSSWNFAIHSPITGRVLRVLQENATVVQPGDRLIELGDPSDLEIWIDLLTIDAVKVRPGYDVIIEHWGGGEPLHARVRLIEPAGFTKISALGVEEKRAWIVADITDPHDQWSALGDNYRVEARVVIWHNEDVLKVPAGALFRHQDGWAVFRHDKGTAELCPIQTGHNNGIEAEVLGGLESGDVVILHPSDKISHGLRISGH